MSERATSQTTELFTTHLRPIFEGDMADRWAATHELKARASELASSGLVDETAIGELAAHNAQVHGLDGDRANQVLDLEMALPNTGWLTAKPPAERVWQGTGSTMATAQGDVVHYVNRPGVVQEWYGPALPYLVAKLGLIAQAAAMGHPGLDNHGGYQYVMDCLQEQDRLAGERVYMGSASNLGTGSADTLVLASATGVLPTDRLHQAVQVRPAYAELSANDSHLLDGHPENRRAGLYDIMAAQQIIAALEGEDLTGKCLVIPPAELYTGTNILD